MARPYESDEMSEEKTLTEKVREAFAATGPVALEVVLTEIAVRITDLENTVAGIVDPE